MSTGQITASQIEAFANSLVKNGIIDKSDIELNKDLIEESLKLSVGQGLQVQLYSYEQVGNISIQKPGFSNYNGQPLVRTEHDAIKIFEMLYTSKRNEIKQKEREAKEPGDRLEYEYWAFCNGTPANERSHPAIGDITLEYFIENPYECPSGTRCPFRFKTEEEAQRHKYRHYAYR